jgi:hypothetical protein
MEGQAEGGTSDLFLCCAISRACREEEVKAAQPRLGRVSAMDEKRKTPRRRVLKEGKIVFADGNCVLDCTIRDMSESGARLSIASTVGIPERFQLFQKSSGLLYPARLAWRQANVIGIQFEGLPTSINDMKDKRYIRLKYT